MVPRTVKKTVRIKKIGKEAQDDGHQGKNHQYSGKIFKPPLLVEEEFVSEAFIFIEKNDAEQSQDTQKQQWGRFMMKGVVIGDEQKQ